MPQDQAVATISQRKWQSPGRARRGTKSPSSYSSCKCPRNNTLWERRVRDTQESGKLTKWSPCIRAECRIGKHETPIGAPMAHGKVAETNQVRCKAIQVEPPQLPKGPNGTKRMGRRPFAKAKRSPMTETVSKDTVQEGRQCDGIEQRYRRKETAEGTLRT